MKGAAWGKGENYKGYPSSERYHPSYAHNSYPGSHNVNYAEYPARPASYRQEDSYCDYQQTGGHPPMRGGYPNVSEANVPRSSYVEEDAQLRLPGIAQKLFSVRDHLTVQSAQAYHALQLTLQATRSSGRVTNFEEEFKINLRMVFADAMSIEATQVGSKAGAAWEVSIDNGPPMYCSVRMEVLGDDAGFSRELKAKARIVKDALLDNGAAWRRALHTQDFSTNKFAQFAQECQRRMDVDPMVRASRTGSRKVWQDARSVCKICKRNREDDQLHGEHMCVVHAAFSCASCQHQWTSYQGRLRPDETVIGQKCVVCRGDGTSTEWKPVDKSGYQGERGSENSRRSGGQHQSELCEACIEFGNCMGFFYDPFILTTALSLVSNQDVRWTSWSAEVPELLYADVGSETSGSQVVVCLQPHVYAKSSADHGKGRGRGTTDFEYDTSSGFASSSHIPLHRPQGSDNHYQRDDPHMDPDYDRGTRSNGNNGNNRLYDARRRQVMAPVNEHQTGVQDQQLLNRFVQDRGNTPFADQSQGDFDAGLSDFLGQSSLSAATPEASNTSAPAERVKSKNKISNSSVTGSVTTGSMSASAGSPYPPRPRSPGSATPYLDELPALRKKQFTHHVKRKANCKEEDKYILLAEEILASVDGDYDKAFKAANDAQYGA